MEYSKFFQPSKVLLLTGWSTSEDQIANDNIFTGSIEMKAGEEKHENIVAVANNLKSQSIDFFFYNELTEDDYEQLNMINAKINEIQQKYLDDEGYIQEENIDALFAEVLNYVEDGKETGLIAEFSKEENCIYLEFSNGIGYMFVPNEKNILSTGEAKRIITIEPNKDSRAFKLALNDIQITNEFRSVDEYEGDYDVISNAQMIAEYNDTYSYDVDMGKLYTGLSDLEHWEKDDDCYINEEVTVDSIKHLATSGVIIWEGHGNYTKDLGSVLITGEDATIYKNLQKYSADIKEQRLIFTGGWQSLGTNFLCCNYVVTPKFFEHYLPADSLEGCLIYLGACNSGTDNRLANSLISKGAKGVYCASDTIDCRYEIRMRTTIIYNLLKQTDSGDFFTAEKALEAAYRTNGAYDPFNENTYITYYGDKEFRLIDNEAIEKKEFDNIIKEEDGIEKSELELGKDLNIFLSDIYDNGIWKYDANDYNIYLLMFFAFKFVDGNQTPLYKDETGNNYYVIDYETINDIIYKYFEIVVPHEQIEYILYRDNKFYFPEWDYEEWGKGLIITNNVNQVSDKSYKVTFDVAYIWHEDFDTGEMNPIKDWDIYYDYDIEQLKEDKFCEMRGSGYAVLEQEGEKLIVKEFYSDNENSESVESAGPLTEEEAYMILEEYWTSLGNEMPDVDYEGLTEYGYCYRGFDAPDNGGLTVTRFRICVDVNTGQLYDLDHDVYLQ